MGTENLFQVVFRKSPVGLVLVDGQDGTIRMVNDCMLKVFDLPSETELRHKHLGEVFNCVILKGECSQHGQAVTCDSCPMKEVKTFMKSGGPAEETVLNHSFVIDRPDERKWFKVNFAPVTVKNKKFFVLAFSDITKEKQYEQLLKEKLMLDLATGVINKYNLLTIIQDLTCNQFNISVAMIDIDNFKTINDTHGHILGDKVLELLVDVAQHNIRKQDILGRFGGDEFMFVFPDSNLDDVVNVICRIRRLFTARCAQELGVTPTFSAGAVSVSAETCCEPEKVINFADDYLYGAKNRGRNRLHIPGREIVFS